MLDTYLLLWSVSFGAGLQGSYSAGMQDFTSEESCLYAAEQMKSFIQAPVSWRVSVDTKCILKYPQHP
jgi:cytochrome c2